MAIPMSALRRALAEMAEGAGAGVQRAYGGSHIDSGIAMGGLPGAIAGGAAGAQYDDGNPLTNETGAGVIGGALGGAMLGGGAGGMAKLVRMGMRGAGGGMSGFSGGLREALAEAASERGIGRAAAREASHVDDAARFAEASEGRRGMMQRVGDYISENPEEVALAGAGASMGVLGGGGLLAIGGGMAAQYQRAQQATGIEDLTMMTPQELAVLGSPKLGEQSAEGEMLRQQAVEIMRQRQKMAQ